MRRGEQPGGGGRGEEYDGIVLKFQTKDDKVGVQIVVAKDRPEDYLVAAREHLEGLHAELRGLHREASRHRGRCNYFTKAYRVGGIEP